MKIYQNIFNSRFDFTFLSSNIFVFFFVEINIQYTGEYNTISMLK